MQKRLCSKLGLAVAIVVAIFILTGAAALAASSGRVESSPLSLANSDSSVATLSVTGTVTPTQPVTGGNMIASSIALFFDVPMTDVVEVRSDGFGFGEIAKAYFLTAAQEDGMTVDEVLALKDSGMGWGEIAMELGLAPGNHGRNLGMIISGRGSVTGTVTGTVSIAAQRLADRVGATPEEVGELLDEGASYGTVMVAYKLSSQYEGVAPGDLVDQRLEGAGWGQIKRSLQGNEAAASGGGPEHGSRGKGRPDHAGPPDHAGRPDHAGPPDHAGKKGRGPKK